MTPIYENLTLAVLDGRTVVFEDKKGGRIYAELLPLPGGDGHGWFRPDGTRIWFDMSEGNGR